MGSNRVRELLDAAKVLVDAGDREGALRLADEALRLAPEDEEARQLRGQLAAAGTPSPFAPPPEDLFPERAPRTTPNPFSRPNLEGAPLAMDAANPFAPPAPPDPAQALGDLLRGALHTLEPGPNAAPEQPVTPAPKSAKRTDPYALPQSRPATQTDPFAKPPPPPPPQEASAFVAPPMPQASVTPPPQARAATLQYASLNDVPSAGMGLSKTMPSLPRPGSLPAGKTGTEPYASLADVQAVAAGKPPAPPSANGAQLEEMLVSIVAQQPPPPPPSESRPASRPPPPPPAAARAASSAPIDAMDLIDQPHVEPAASIDGSLKRARELLEFADHSGALQLIDQVLASSPSHAEALALKARCEATLTSMFESKLGNLTRRPKLRLRPDEVIWLNLDHRAGFVLAQIDGQVSLEDLFDLSGMSRLDTARILAQLVEERVIQLN